MVFSKCFFSFAGFEIPQHGLTTQAGDSGGGQKIISIGRKGEGIHFACVTGKGPFTHLGFAVISKCLLTATGDGHGSNGLFFQLRGSRFGDI